MIGCRDGHYYITVSIVLLIVSIVQTAEYGCETASDGSGTAWTGIYYFKEKSERFEAFSASTQSEGKLIKMFRGGYCLQGQGLARTVFPLTRLTFLLKLIKIITPWIYKYIYYLPSTQSPDYNYISMIYPIAACRPRVK